ncbi:MAG: helix-turn-helix transcriptional regulator [Bacteroidota bacterium]
MTDRISLLIKAKNLSAAQFADEIGVQRSSISHLMSGRNKPSLDLIQKTLQRFPEVSSEWLLFGKGEMVRELNLFDSQTRSLENTDKLKPDYETLPKDEIINQAPSVVAEANIYEIQQEYPLENGNSRVQTQANLAIDENQPMQDKTQPRVAFKDESRKDTVSRKSNKEGSIAQIIVLYDDHTFVAYSPGN